MTILGTFLIFYDEIPLYSYFQYSKMHSALKQYIFTLFFLGLYVPLVLFRVMKLDCSKKHNSNDWFVC